MSNYKLKFTLKQHTPIIHFQYDQHGATLRASELKPKLDKFLIEKFKNENINYSKWLIAGQDNALDYKVRIDSSNIDTNIISNRKKIPNYFANMGKEFKKNPKGFSYSDNKFQLTFFIVNNLNKKICDYFPEFIAKTNFGTRQNKGFGSFYLTEESDCYKQISEVLNHHFYLQIDSVDNEIIYSSIEYYYRRLKAGINNNFNTLCTQNCDSEKYKKSFLFKHFNKNTNFGWEKRWIKETFFGLNSDNIEKFFLRAFLGIPESYIYKPTLEPCYKKINPTINSSYKIEDEYEIEIVNKNIERFKSPITFKPIKFQNKTKIYIIPNKSYEDLFKNDAPFKFYKKFVVNYANTNNGRIKFEKEKSFPDIDGSNFSIKNKIIKKLEKQENDLQILLDYNINDSDDKRKIRNECTLRKIISGQKNRFEQFLKECNISNRKYYPPSDYIYLPPKTTFEFDIPSILAEYHKELKEKFTFKFKNVKYKATIKKLN